MHQSSVLYALAGLTSVVAGDLSGTLFPRSSLTDLTKRQLRICPSVPASTPLEQLCEASCGPGYTQCTDYYTCFNPSAGQICCSDGTHCDTGVGCCEDAGVSTVTAGYLTVSTITPSASSSSPSASTSSVVITDSRSASSSSSSSSPSSAAPYTSSSESSSSSAAPPTYAAPTTSSISSSTSSTVVVYPTSSSRTGNFTTSATSPSIAVQTTNAGARFGADLLGQIVGSISLLVFWL